MDFSNPAQRRIFFEIHAGLPRQSAGSDGSTLRALSLVADRLPPAPEIADMACGPGAAAVLLAEALPEANVCALDLHQPFLDELIARAEKARLLDRITPQCADMVTPLAEMGPLDMIWCEGGIYNIGVEAGLRAWKPMLRAGGLVVFNEPVWLVAETDRAPEVRAFWGGYAGMTDVQGVERAIKAAGYSLLGGFDLPEADWWATYYDPMRERLDRLADTYDDDTNAQAPMAHTRAEIDMRERYAAAYNYRFFAVQLT